MQPVPERIALTPDLTALVMALIALLQAFGYRINRCVPKDGSERYTLPTFAAADVPAAADWEGAVIYVPDGSAGQKFRGSDGTNWVNLG